MVAEATRVTGDATSAEDVVQDARLRLSHGSTESGSSNPPAICVGWYATWRWTNIDIGLRAPFTRLRRRAASVRPGAALPVGGHRGRAYGVVRLLPDRQANHRPRAGATIVLSGIGVPVRHATGKWPCSRSVSQPRPHSAGRARRHTPARPTATTEYVEGNYDPATRVFAERATGAASPIAAAPRNRPSTAPSSASPPFAGRPCDGPALYPIRH
jgi:hypothetical protein